MAELEIDDIQGILISGYGHLSHSRYLFLQITDAALAKAWLQQMLPANQTTDLTITTADWRSGKPSVAVNLALTFLGLQKLGLYQETLQYFSEEFREGMAAPDRARLLGDWGKNDPACWEMPFRTGEKDDYCNQYCHLLLILQAETKPKLDQLYQRHLESMQGVEELRFGNTDKLLCEGYSSGQRSNLGENAARSIHQGQVFRTEHFGFHDNISQPEIEGSPALLKKLVQQPVLQQDVIKAGEFILGYLNEDQVFPEHPGLRKFGRNGSYLVFRKLAQDVAAFRKYLQEQSSDPVQQKYIAAKFVGRWQSGAPLVLHPQSDPAESWNLNSDRTFSDDHEIGIQDRSISAESLSATNSSGQSSYEPENRFGYRSLDADGLRCPLGAHIRRANPRDALGQESQSSIASVRRHRILRRGALYGDRLPDGLIENDRKDRGVLFICINANIKRQFEFIQNMWINNPRFSGLNHETDPLVGSYRDSHANNPSHRESEIEKESGIGDCSSFAQNENSARQFTIQRSPIRQRFLDMPDFVTLKGGGYFFLPSISALRILATLGTVAEETVTESDLNESAEKPYQSSEYAPSISNESY